MNHIGMKHSPGSLLAPRLCIKLFEPTPQGIAISSPCRTNPLSSLFLFAMHLEEIARSRLYRRLLLAASYPEGAERPPSADRSQQILNTAGRRRDSAARLC
jgi:hypothetical protein